MCHFVQDAGTPVWKGGYSTEDFVAFKLGSAGPLMIYSSQRAVNGREVDQDLDHGLLDEEV